MNSAFFHHTETFKSSSSSSPSSSSRTESSCSTSCSRLTGSRGIHSDSNLLGYQSVNVINPTEPTFQRTYVINTYYMTVYGRKLSDYPTLYQVQYTKKYADGRTQWYTETLDLRAINDILDHFEIWARKTEDHLRLSNISGLN